MKRTHGMSRTAMYKRWRSMRNRCENPNAPVYKNYGGRGIRVCERWRDFELFAADMGPAPSGCSIDRINNDGNYEPGNCRWATRADQNRNTRRVHLITHEGRTQCVADWALELGLSWTTARYRLGPKRVRQKIARCPGSQSKDITGQRYGLLVAVRYSHTIKKAALWVFRCDCGNQVVRRAYSVKQRPGSSCGCRRSEAARLSRCG